MPFTRTARLASAIAFVALAAPAAETLIERPLSPGETENVTDVAVSANPSKRYYIVGSRDNNTNNGYLTVMDSGFNIARTIDWDGVPLAVAVNPDASGDHTVVVAGYKIESGRKRGKITSHNLDASTENASAFFPATAHTGTNFSTITDVTVHAGNAHFCGRIKSAATTGLGYAHDKANFVATAPLSSLTASSPAYWELQPGELRGNFYHSDVVRAVQEQENTLVPNPTFQGESTPFYFTADAFGNGERTPIPPPQDLIGNTFFLPDGNRVIDDVFDTDVTAYVIDRGDPLALWSVSDNEPVPKLAVDSTGNTYVSSQLPAITANQLEFLYFGYDDDRRRNVAYALKKRPVEWVLTVENLGGTDFGFDSSDTIHTYNTSADSPRSYVLKFNPDLDRTDQYFDANPWDEIIEGLEPDRPQTTSTEILELATDGSSVYALRHYAGASPFESGADRDDSQGGSRDIDILKLDGLLEVQQRTTIKSSVDILGGSLDVAADGSHLFVSGIYGQNGAAATFGGSNGGVEIGSSRERWFMGRLSTDTLSFGAGWVNTSKLPESAGGTATLRIDRPVFRTDPDGGLGPLVGSFRNAKIGFGTGESDFMATGQAGFITFLDPNGAFGEFFNFAVNSDIGINGVKINGALAGLAGSGDTVSFLGGSIVEVQVPEFVYLDRDRDELPILPGESEVTDEQIETDAVTRYSNTGFSFQDGAVVGSENLYRFVIEKDSSINFNWVVEHAIEIGSDLRGTGAPVAHWKLDDPQNQETNPRTALDTMRTRDGVVGSGITLGQPPASGLNQTSSSASFPGNDTDAGLVRVPYTPELAAESFSLGLWVDPVVGPGLQSLVNFRSSSRGFEVALRPDGTGLSVTIRQGPGEPELVFLIDTDIAGGWTHVTTTYDDARKRLQVFKNGEPVLDTTVGAGFVPAAPGNDFLIGGRQPGSASAPFEGRLDDIQFYGRAISTSEIGDMIRGRASGLASLASGLPSPAVKKHWIVEDELFTAFIDGTVTPLDQFSTRYRVTGYRVTGSADSGSDFVPFTSVEARQQIPQFAVDNPGTVTFEWTIQHRIQVGTTNSRADSLPAIKVNADPPGSQVVQSDAVGTGTFWFDQGSDLSVGSASDNDQELNGVFNASGALQDIDGFTVEQLEQDPAFIAAFQVNGRPHDGLRIANLTGGALVTWGYGDTIYPQTVVIGSPVDLTVLPAEIAVNTGIEPVVTAILDDPPAPAGSTAADMHVWDDVADLSYPLRPGRFLLEWRRQGNGDLPLVTEITSELPSTVDRDAFSEELLPEELAGKQGRTSAVAVADFDGDGYADIVTATDSTTGSMRLYRHNGSQRGFQNVAPLSFGIDGEPVYDLAVGDVNGDGFPDIVAAGSAVDYLFLNNGTTGPFAAVEPFRIAPGTGEISSLALGDINGDGHLDLVTGNISPTAQNRIFINDGDPSGNPFDTTTPVTFGDASDRSRDVTLADLNGDGLLDLAVANTDLGNASKIYLNNGLTNGAPHWFSDPPTNLGNPGDNTVSIATGDMDNDGDIDVVHGNRNQRNRLYLNNGTASPFAGVSGLDMGGERDTTLSIALVDLTANGVLDVVVGNLGQPDRYYVNKRTDPPFDTVVSQPLTGDPTDTNALAAADIDGDGDTDVITGIDSHDTPDLVFINRIPDSGIWRHVYHPEMPPVDLDPSADDEYTFLELEYSEFGADASAADNKFIVTRRGASAIGTTANGRSKDGQRTVLLFSHRDPVEGPGNGDLSRETLRVRVVETRRFNSDPTGADPDLAVTERDLGSWNNSSKPLLLDATTSTPVGSPIDGGTRFDRAAIGTGFLVFDGNNPGDLRYNPDIYDRSLVAAAGPVIPVNRRFDENGEPADNLTVVWYETQFGNILFPWQPVRYQTSWPAVSSITTTGSGAQELDRIVIASRLGSEGKNAGGINQTSFDPARFSEVRIYQQSDKSLPGFNPNEEHALIAPSLLFAESPSRPPTAYALRSGDLNVSAQDVETRSLSYTDDYTSDPYVLVEYFDNLLGAYRMAVYSITGTDPAYPAIDPLEIAASNIATNTEITFTRSAHGLRDGEKVRVTFDGELRGLTSRSTYFVTAATAGSFQLAPAPGATPVAGDGATPPDVTVERRFPYQFDYPAVAGEPVQPPYPLGLVIGLTPGRRDFGEDSSTQLTYWRDRRNQAWAVSGDGALDAYFHYPLQPGAYWPNSGVAIGDFVAFGADINAASELVATVKKAALGTAALQSFVADPDIAVGDPESDPVTLTIPGDQAPRRIHYRTSWPASTPVLKVGETLTHPGGEFKADNPGPDQPGLPGVIGWASGQVVFDSLNPAMSTSESANSYSARVIAPLEQRSVELPAADPAVFAPATGITRVDGTVWRFTDLPSSLAKRVAFDPLDNRLTLVGFVNDLTLGDATLTAAPPPVYVVEPNVLTYAERERLLAMQGADAITGWEDAVISLFNLSRDPADLTADTSGGGAYLVGLEPAGSTPSSSNALPGNYLGPGLAVVPGPQLLAPETDWDPDNDGNDNPLYVTLVENNHPEIDGPITLHIVRLERQHRYRGAIKTILASNIFEEKITLRHTGDFGGNIDNVTYQWFYREEDGTAAPLPPESPWKLFPDQRDITPKGTGLYQIDLEGTGGLVLADNLFFVRYRHNRDTPADGLNGIDWSNTDWQEVASAPQGEPGELWAGAGNSPTVGGDYLPQLAQGWVKRILDRINPYEARIDDFRNTAAPATYTSMIQQLGPRFEGPVALNPDKDVIENVGLIALYETVLQRAVALSIGLDTPVSTPGINNAIQLAAGRLSDFYMLLGNEAYADAQDPLVGYGTNSDEYGFAAPSIFSFQNQVASPLEEELALLRGVPTSFGRPVYNRLFWNFTKSDGEVAYALNYNLSDENLDGFIDESDALARYPQGHGDAWGHYSSALAAHYRLLAHPFYNWQRRTELYNLLDVVIDVDFQDERKFASAAAARAKAGAEIVNQTYRSRYVADPDGQWQGYTDTDTDRAWGVQGWARRSGQAALFDWMTATALIPSEDSENSGVVNEAFKRIDRTTVSSLRSIAANLREIQATIDDADQGVNPLGLDPDAVPFDIDPTFIEVGSGTQGEMPFEQVYARAETALANAVDAFDYASAQQVLVRTQQDNTDSFRNDVIDQDRDYANRLIEIFGTPYAGQIGTGKAYPAGYKGPDLFLWMYVDVADFVGGVPVADPTVGQFAANFAAFDQAVVALEQDRDFVSNRAPYFVGDIDLGDVGSVTGVTPPAEDSNAVLDMPVTADGYAFQAPEDWGRRASPGRLQEIVNELLAAEANLTLTLGNYDNYIKELKDMVDLLEAKHDLAADTIEIKNDLKDTTTDLSRAVIGLDFATTALRDAADFAIVLAEAIQEGVPKVTGLSSDYTFGARLAIWLSGAIGQIPLRATAGALEGGARGLELDIEEAAQDAEITIDTEGFKYEIREALKEIEQHLRNDGAWRVDIFLQLQALRQASDQFRTELENGLRLLDEREHFNRTVAGASQEVRYQDMAFRIFRNDALQKHRASFDLAARYAWLAARAYDYETNLHPNDPGSATSVMEQIVKARHLGVVADGSPTHAGGGLAAALATLRDNFSALEGRLGINQPQSEFGKLSLRQELFRILPPMQTQPDAPGFPRPNEPSDDVWRDTLASFRVDDLWQIPEFRRYCRPPAPRSAGPIPGLVIPFSSNITEGLNFFGRPLAAGDHAYDPTQYSTKIRAAGVWFEGYDSSVLAATPRVYLIPVGTDVLTIPGSLDLQTREWNVVDLAVPTPVPSPGASLDAPDWLPVRDTLEGTFTETRKFSRFRAYANTSDTADESELVFDTRLVGRSAWNTRWLLVIPGTSLLSDGGEALDKFIGVGPGADPGWGGIQDINLHFETYGFSGN